MLSKGFEIISKAPSFFPFVSLSLGAFAPQSCGVVVSILQFSDSLLAGLYPFEYKQIPG
jgi:hypothetical protein